MKANTSPLTITLLLLPALVHAAQTTAITVDDDQSERVGRWWESTKAEPFHGRGYRYADSDPSDAASARFAPNLPEAGQYEVRLLFPATYNRATNAKVTIISRNGEKTFRVNQRQDPYAGAVPMAVGVFPFDEGLSVLLVHYTEHLGGMLANGLAAWDTLHEGRRSPIYDEMRWGIFDYYRRTYGDDSAQYRACLPGPTGHTNGLFEPKVAELLFTRLVAREERITVLKPCHTVGVERNGPLIRSITLHDMETADSVEVHAKIFADCTYTGDLAAAAEVPYRLGRESRDEHDEPHAGRIFMRKGSGPKTPADERLYRIRKSLKLRTFGHWQETLRPESTGEGDRVVQAMNMRPIVTCDPDSRLLPTKPPVYDPSWLRRLDFYLGFSGTRHLPNRKLGMNRPQLLGPHEAYVEGDLDTRRGIIQQHSDATKAVLYFRQHDPSVPQAERERLREYGFAKDEFADNGHMPYEIYVREGRRIVGRHTLTEHDVLPSVAFERAPVYADSVGIIDWYIDVHACHDERIRDSLREGKLMLHYQTIPGQIPYRCLLPQGTDNLLVPVCLSSTHVAQSALRLEPTWMNVGESAGFAAAQAIQTGKTPAEIDVDRLVRTIAEKRVMIAFFNDIDLAADDPRVPAAQYFGAKGLFAGHDAKLDAPLTEAVKAVWEQGFQELQAGTLDPTQLASAVHAAEAGKSAAAGETRGAMLARLWSRQSP